jgi:hypothetical protein
VHDRGPTGREIDDRWVKMHVFEVDRRVERLAREVRGVLAGLTRSTCCRRVVVPDVGKGTGVQAMC